MFGFELLPLFLQSIGKIFFFFSVGRMKMGFGGKVHVKLQCLLPQGSNRII